MDKYLLRFIRLFLVPTLLLSTIPVAGFDLPSDPSPAAHSSLFTPQALALRPAANALGSTANIAARSLVHLVRPARMLSLRSVADVSAHMVGGPLNLLLLHRIQELLRLSQVQSRTALYLNSGADLSTALESTNATTLVLVERLPFNTPYKIPNQEAALHEYLADKQSRGYVSSRLLRRLGAIQPALELELKELGAQHVDLEFNPNFPQLVRVTFDWRGESRIVFMLCGTDSLNTDVYLPYVQAAGGASAVILKAGHYNDIGLRKMQLIIEAATVQVLNPRGVLLVDRADIVSEIARRDLTELRDEEGILQNLERQGAALGYLQKSSDHAQGVYLFQKQEVSSTPGEPTSRGGAHPQSLNSTPTPTREKFKAMRDQTAFHGFTDQLPHMKRRMTGDRDGGNKLGMPKPSRRQFVQLIGALTLEAAVIGGLKTLDPLLTNPSPSSLWVPDKTIIRPGPRAVGYHPYRLEGNVLVLDFPGFPASGAEHTPELLDILQELKIDFVGFDPWWIGSSDGWPGHPLADILGDAEALVKELGHKRFIPFGWSLGGAPAMAAARSSNAIHLGLVSSFGPVETPQQRQFYSKDYVSQWWWAVNFPPLAGLKFRNEIQSPLLTNPDDYYRRLIQEMSRDDRRILQKPGVKDLILASRIDALHQGTGAVASYLQTVFSPWGFSLSDIHVPTHSWHGKEDPIIPWQVGQMIAVYIAYCNFTLLEGRGHTFVLEGLHAILNTITSPYILLPDAWAQLLKKKAIRAGPNQTVWEALAQSSERFDDLRKMLFSSDQINPDRAQFRVRVVRHTGANERLEPSRWDRFRLERGDQLLVDPVHGPLDRMRPMAQNFFPDPNPLPPDRLDTPKDSKDLSSKEVPNPRVIKGVFGTSPAALPLKVLLVGSGHSLNTAARAFQAQGHDVLRADSSSSALKLYELEKPNLVLINFGLLSNENGLELSKKLYGLNQRLPIVLLTSGGYDDYVRRGYQYNSSVPRHETLTDFKTKMTAEGKPLPDIQVYAERTSMIQSEWETWIPELINYVRSVQSDLSAHTTRSSHPGAGEKMLGGAA